MITETRSDLPASRAEAKRLGYKHYFTGKPCKHGHVDIRLVSTANCVSCCKKYSEEWNLKYPDYNRKSCKQRYWKNVEKSRQENKERNRRYREESVELSRARALRWARQNPEYFAARSAAKRAQRPVWLTEQDHDKIKQHYRVARLLTRRYNIAYEVDHVVPLAAEQASGLHCPANLQILPVTENRSKGNKLDPDVGVAAA